MTQVCSTRHDGVRYYRPHIHPQPFAYHFDIMGLWNELQQPARIIFLSFRAELLTKRIMPHQLPGHSIYLVRADQPELIEVGSEGSRDAFTRPPRLSMEEHAHAIVRLDVPGTRWQAVGLLQPAFLSRFQSRSQPEIQYSRCCSDLFLADFPVDPASVETT